MEQNNTAKKKLLTKLDLKNPTTLGIIAVIIASIGLLISIITFLLSGGISEINNINGLQFYPDGNGNYIVAAGDAKYLDEIVIPKRYRGGKVIGIADEGFSSCDNLTSIVIPDTVITIGEYAFQNCDVLTNVKFGSGLVDIGIHAFSNCSSLKTADLQSNLISIGEYAFYNCVSMTNINIPNSVKSVGDNAFTNCDALSMYEYANAYYLGSRENPCHTLLKVKSTDITEIKIHSSAKIIYFKAFEYCTSLKSVDIPEGATEIGVEAFYGCTSLESIIIPSTLVTVHDGAFYECEALTEVNYTGNESQLYLINVNYNNDPFMDATFYFNYYRTN